MTTVIANDKFMIADHRVTDHFKPNHRSDVQQYSRTAMMNSFSDSFHKLKVIDNKRSNSKTSEGKSPVCMGGSGSASEMETFTTAFYSINEPSIEKKLKLIKELTKISRLTVLFMLEDGCKLTAEFKPGAGLKVDELVAGVGVAIGSGSSILRELGAFDRDDLTVEELLFIASYLDNYTSSSYSVFSLEEMVLYQNVIPDPRYVRKTAWKAFQRLNPFKKLPTQYLNVKNDVCDILY